MPGEKRRVGNRRYYTRAVRATRTAELLWPVMPEVLCADEGRDPLDGLASRHQRGRPNRTARASSQTNAGLPERVRSGRLVTS